MDNSSNNNSNNESNNIVAPQNVNLNNVSTNNNDTMLNRERANIVSATIQANNSIDKKQAIEVNNTIKVEKHHSYMFIVVIVTIIIVCVVAGFGIYKLTSAAVNYSDNSTSTTTTTTAEIDRFNSYLRDYKRVRKFVSNNYILLLSTDGCDLKDNKEHYLLINTSKDGIIENTTGTYTIENNTVKLDNQVLEYDKDGIKYKDELFKIYDSEMKFYQYKDDNISYLLIINATMKNEIAMFIMSNKGGFDVKVQTFRETDSSITLGDNTVFTKVDANITYNNYTLNRVS